MRGCAMAASTIFQSGLHEFLTDFIAQNNALGTQLQEDFLMTRAAVAGAA
jgi:uncharacterized alpha-E superfamily protein